MKTYDVVFKVRGLVGKWKKLFRKRKALEKAREEFYTAIEKVSRGEYDDNVPVPGITGELVGSSEKERDGGDKR